MGRDFESPGDELPFRAHSCHGSRTCFRNGGVSKPSGGRSGGGGGLRGFDNGERFDVCVTMRVTRLLIPCLLVLSDVVKAAAG